MQITEAIILAGGLGTRLKSAVPDVPKCMAPVNGRPFIAYVIELLHQQGIKEFIFSLGYRSDAFTDFLGGMLPAENYQLVVEKEPLGTGGAIQLACRNVNGDHMITLNGDSIFKVDLASQCDFHVANGADCTLSLKYLEHFDRYGAVTLNPDRSIAAFEEKKYYERGLINGGVYIINKNSFLAEGLPEKFSFETDYLQSLYAKRKMYGFEQKGYFIDIGIPEDYQRAQKELTD